MRAAFCQSEPESEFGAPPLNPGQNLVHPPKPESEFGAPLLNPSQNLVHPPKSRSEFGGPHLKRIVIYKA